MAEHRKGIDKLSIIDIAKMAGVSTATVSRVINKSGPVASKTEKLVNDIISRYDYVPNLAARGMRTNRLPAIGLVIPSVRNEYFSDLATIFQKLFMDLGYFVFLCTTNNDAQVEKESIRILAGQYVSGLIIISKDVVPSVIPESLPTVCIDCQPCRPCDAMIAKVESDNRGGGYMATNALIQSGCREIVLFTGSEEAYTARERAQGYFSALMQAGLQIDLRRVFHFHSYDYANGELLVKQLLQSGVAYDGIFAICDYVLQGSLDALIERGIQIPDKVKVCGFDDLYMAQLAGRKLTTIHQDSRLVAQTTVQLLTQMIAGQVPEEKEITIPVKLIRRATA